MGSRATSLNKASDNDSCLCPPEAPYGPYYRYETNPMFVAQAWNQGMLYGRTPKNNGFKPTVQAYRLPKDASNELKFCTSVKPTGVGPIHSWYQGDPGVIYHDDDTVKIPIVPIK